MEPELVPIVSYNLNAQGQLGRGPRRPPRPRSFPLAGGCDVIGVIT